QRRYRKQVQDADIDVGDHPALVEGDHYPGNEGDHHADSGARKKITLLAPAGMITSLNRNFIASAMVCSRPKGPTTLGPRLICTAAQILRSARITAATASINTRLMTRMNTDWLRNQAQP